MSREVTTNHSPTENARRLRDELLSGVHARADWRQAPRSMAHTNEVPETLQADINGFSVYLTSHWATGDFTLLVADGRRRPGAPTTASGLALSEAVRVLGSSEREWLRDRYRGAVAQQLRFALSALGTSHHRQAREYMAAAQEMSCALQSIEGDPTKQPRSVRSGRHLKLVTALREHAAT